MSESTYSVYLVERHGEQGGEREVTSPVRGHGLEFYDSGVWLDRDRGRSFFPYEQIRTIREHPEGESTERETEAGEDTDSRPSEDAGNRTPEQDDSGAEEELLE